MPGCSEFTTYTKNFVPQVPGSYCLHDPASFRRSGSFFRGPLARHLLLTIALVAGAVSSTGCAKKVPVPDVVKGSQDLDQAIKILKGASLEPGTITGVPANPPPGAYVASQDPLPGQQVAANSKVHLVVKVPVTVPVLTGLEITEAVSILQGLGLKVGFVKHPTILSLGKVKVEQQNPAPNSLVHDDAQVMLTMSAPSLDFGALLGLVAKEPAYQNLKPEYKNVLDAFMGNPNVTRGMDPSTPTD